MKQAVQATMCMLWPCWLCCILDAQQKYELIEIRPHRRCRGAVVWQQVIQTDLSDWYSFSWSDFRSNMAAPWAALGSVSVSANKPPTSAQLGSNFSPAWHQYGATWSATRTHLGTTSASKWGTWPAQYGIVKTRVFTAIPAFFCHRWCFVLSNVPHLVPPLGPAWREAANLRHWRDLDFHLHHTLSIWGPRAQEVGPKNKTTRANFADSIRHPENLHFYLHFQFFLVLMNEGLVQGHVARIGLVLGPRPLPQHRTKLCT